MLNSSILFSEDINRLALKRNLRSQSLEITLSQQLGLESLLTLGCQFSLLLRLGFSVVSDVLPCGTISGVKHTEFVASIGIRRIGTLLQDFQARPQPFWVFIIILCDRVLSTLGVV